MCHPLSKVTFLFPPRSVHPPPPSLSTHVFSPLVHTFPCPCPPLLLPLSPRHPPPPHTHTHPTHTSRTHRHDSSSGNESHGGEGFRTGLQGACPPAITLVICIYKCVCIYI
jgi:hypothetical protein